MNWPHVHLMINHIPVIGIPGAALLLICALVGKSEDVKKASMGLLVLIALMTFAVYFTGDMAQKTVKKLPGVTEMYIDRHEEMADWTLVLTEILGVFSLAGLAFQRRLRRIPNAVAALVLVLSLITAVAAGVTANLGGQIRHTEIRSPNK